MWKPKLRDDLIANFSNFQFLRADRALFLDVLSETVDRFNWVIHAYCLMGNNYHLLIETPDGNLSQDMRQLNGVYTQRFKRKHKRRLWHERNRRSFWVTLFKGQPEVRLAKEKTPKWCSKRGLGAIVTFEARLEIFAVNYGCPLEANTAVSGHAVIGAIVVSDDLGAASGHAFNALCAVVVHAPCAFQDFPAHLTMGFSVRREIVLLGIAVRRQTVNSIARDQFFDPFGIQGLSGLYGCGKDYQSRKYKCRCLHAEFSLNVIATNSPTLKCRTLMAEARCSTLKVTCCRSAQLAGGQVDCC